MEVETAWIPMPDGRRLAARLFLPSAAASTAEPAPAILEYIPYRRRDWTRTGDEGMHRWFAAHGYASARVDIAGMGDSDGTIGDEYVEREQDDGCAVIEWLAEQPWCNGSVGIIGISWGGFVGLQLAARRPPALRAVISVCSTADRYHHDAHFTGGLLNEENLEWGGCFFAMHGFPPDPAIVGADRWRTMWRERIDAATLSPAVWLEHQRRDSFWRHGSVIEDFDSIEVPVLSVSGWADGYTATVFQLVESLTAPCKGMIGPWGHKYPQDGVPGPAVGFLDEALRWWDQWLGGIDRGVADDPAMRMYLQDAVVPASHIAERPGRWIGFNEWPPVDDASTRYWLTSGTLGSEPGAATRTTVRSPQTVGTTSGQWCAYGQGKIAPELSIDQRVDDAGSACFDTSLLQAPLHLAGEPVLHVRVASDQPIGFIAVRLNDVHPDGTSERLSFGVLNLCHRTSHEHPEPLVPGQPYDVTVTMKGIAQTIPAGHRLRVAVSTSFWPMIWPSPQPVTLTLHDEASSIVLPTHDRVQALLADVMGSPRDALAGGVTQMREGRERRYVTLDLAAATTEYVVGRDDGVYRLDDTGTEISFSRIRTTTIGDGDPLSQRVTFTSEATFRRLTEPSGAWDTRIESVIDMTCDETHFHLVARLTTFDEGALFAERRFQQSIPRDHM